MFGLANLTGRHVPVLDAMIACMFVCQALSVQAVMRSTSSCCQVRLIAVMGRSHPPAWGAQHLLDNLMGVMVIATAPCSQSRHTVIWCEADASEKLLCNTALQLRLLGGARSAACMPQLRCMLGPL